MKIETSYFDIPKGIDLGELPETNAPSMRDYRTEMSQLHIKLKEGVTAELEQLNHAVQGLVEDASQHVANLKAIYDRTLRQIYASVRAKQAAYAQDAWEKGASEGIVKVASYRGEKPELRRYRLITPDTYVGDLLINAPMVVGEPMWPYPAFSGIHNIHDGCILSYPFSQRFRPFHKDEFLGTPPSCPVFVEVPLGEPTYEELLNASKPVKLSKYAYVPRRHKFPVPTEITIHEFRDIFYPYGIPFPSGTQVIIGHVSKRISKMRKDEVTVFATKLPTDGWLVWVHQVRVFPKEPSQQRSWTVGVLADYEVDVKVNNKTFQVILPSDIRIRNPRKADIQFLLSLQPHLGYVARSRNTAYRNMS